MVLLHVLRALGHPCVVAHADHGLRGMESDGDREFVVQHCRELRVDVVTTRLPVASHAQVQGISVQMAARELRYAWLNELHEADAIPIALAHHADDSIETLFINLLRGAGVHGWAGIPPVSGPFIRPLLAVHRDAIERYAREHSVLFREDSSNTDPKYLRNRIRHELLPLLEDLRPGARRTLSRSIGLMREIESLGERSGVADLPGSKILENGDIHVPLTSIDGSPAPLVMLHRLLGPMGFHPDMIERVLDAVRSRATGALFTAGTCQVCVDRVDLIMGAASAEWPSCIIDPAVSQGQCGPFQWSFGVAPPLNVPKGMEEVVLDADRLAHPLELRPWRAGDRMRPLGLGGSKLVSDILVDAKVPITAKAGTYVLVSDGEVVWLVGHRISEGFQATATSCRILRCGFHDPPR